LLAAQCCAKRVGASCPTSCTYGTGSVRSKQCAWATDWPLIPYDRNRDVQLMPNIWISNSRGRYSREITYSQALGRRRCYSVDPTAGVHSPLNMSTIALLCRETELRPTPILESHGSASEGRLFSFHDVDKADFKCLSSQLSDTLL
jgi:hypothetical protein